MKASHERHLRVLSGIDDGILERTTATRAHLWQERRSHMRKRLRQALLGSASAVLVVSILLVVLLPLFGKQVPIYRGMSVSGTAEVALSAVSDDEPIIRTHASELRFAGDGKQTKGNEGNNGNHYGNDNGNGNANENGQANDLSPIGGTYYATPGEDILITVHIDNPDNFEILSFTLNGVTYSSYMFEEGSTMESLVLKVNVGDAEGFREYTIDAIKYVDGTAIKDVRMKGERTIRVGVAAEGNNLGTATVLTDATYTGLSFDVEICDVLGILEDTSIPVHAKLYQGDVLIRTERVTLSDGVATVAFAQLAPGAIYRLDITATYDKDDGVGKVEHVLTSAVYETSHPFTFKHTVDIQPRYYISNGYIYNEEIPRVPQWDTYHSVVLYAKLLCADERFTVLSATQTKNGATQTLTDLSAIPVGRGESTVRVTYTLDGQEYTSELTLSDVLSTEELSSLYYVVTPYQKNQHDGVDIGCLASYTCTGSWEEARAALGSAWDEEAFTQYPQFKTYLERTETYIPVYALTSGFWLRGTLYCTDSPSPDMMELFSASYFEYRISSVPMDFPEDEGVYVEAGTFLGVCHANGWAPLKGCNTEQAMHLSYHSMQNGTNGYYDPLPLLPIQ